MKVTPLAEDSHRAARLCAACGMCCDGTLFHGMRLQPEDSARKLQALGLKSKRGQMAQPCRAHKGNSCHIYPDRPQRCRQFSCRQLRDLAEEKLSEYAALKTIHKATRLRDQVLSLLRRCGEDREHRPLAVRYAAAFTPPLNPSPKAVRDRESLRSARQKLEQLLAHSFRTEPSADDEPISVPEMP